MNSAIGQETVSEGRDIIEVDLLVKDNVQAFPGLHVTDEAGSKNNHLKNILIMTLC